MQSREALYEKLKNALTVLAAETATVAKSTSNLDAAIKDGGSVMAAFNILSS